MPNWCENNAYITGEKQNLDNFIAFLKNALNQAKNEGLWDTFVLMRESGLDPEHNFNYIRGTVYHYQRNENNIFISFDSAWSPMIPGFNQILEKFNLKAVYLCVETGCEIFINTDTTREFFHKNYYVDAYNDKTGDYIDEHDFINLEDVIPQLQKLFNFKSNNINYYKNHKFNNDSYIVIEEYGDF